jgi:hypothetical protein
VGVRHASGEVNKGAGKYCTNNPNVCTPVPAAQGNGPVASAFASIGGLFGGAKKPGDCGCDTKEACKDIGRMQRLIEKYTRGDPRWRDYQEFVGKFDDLMSDLSNYDLSCRYNQGNSLPPGVDQKLKEIYRERRGLKTLGTTRNVPTRSDCAWKRNYLEYRPTSQEQARCGDFEAIQRMYGMLGDLAAQLGCPTTEEDDKAPFNPCPELGSAQEVKDKLDKASTWTERVGKLSKDKKTKQTLERVTKILKWLTKHLGRVLKGRKYCSLVDDLLKKIDALDRAQTPEQNTKAFDDLFKSLFNFGEEVLPPPFDEFAKSLKDTTFFADNYQNLVPQERWKNQFEGILDPTTPNDYTTGGNR